MLCLTRSRPDTEYIYINVGLGFHPALTHDEAKAFLHESIERLEEYARTWHVILQRN